MAMYDFRNIWAEELDKAWDGDHAKDSMPAWVHQIIDRAAIASMFRAQELARAESCTSAPADAADTEKLTRIAVDGADLTIRIPVKTMLYAFVNDPKNEAWDAESDQHKPPTVTDEAGFVAEVIRELDREDDDGTTPVHLMMDAAMREAVEQGSQHIYFPGDDNNLAMQKP